MNGRFTKHLLKNENKGDNLKFKESYTRIGAKFCGKCKITLKSWNIGTRK